MEDHHYDVIEFQTVSDLFMVYAYKTKNNTTTKC